MFYYFFFLNGCSSDDAAPADIVWQLNVGGALQDQVNDAVLVQDGIVVVGLSRSRECDVNKNHGEGDLLIAKVDLSGNLLWTQTYGGSQNDEGHAIFQTADEGFLVVGANASTNGDITINKED